MFSLKCIEAADAAQMPGGMPKSFSHSHLPMHYSGPSMMPYQGTMAPSRWLVRTLPKLTQSAALTFSG